MAFHAYSQISMNINGYQRISHRGWGGPSVNRGRSHKTRPLNSWLESPTHHWLASAYRKASLDLHVQVAVKPSFRSTSAYTSEVSASESLLGFSQNDYASQAHVSQMAVSRLRRCSQWKDAFHIAHFPMIDALRVGKQARNNIYNMFIL